MSDLFYVNLRSYVACKQKLFAILEDSPYEVGENQRTKMKRHNLAYKNPQCMNMIQC
jgi:hypothetical protein